MMRYVTAICYLFYACVAYSQRLSPLNAKLDSIVSAPNPGHKVKCIYLMGNKVVVDSMTIKKARSSIIDSTVIITYTDNTKKRIKAAAFWGVVTDYGECRRFYNGRSFPVWSQGSPYFYRVSKTMSDRYYFSETLTGDIHPLTLTNVNRYVADSVERGRLTAFIKDKFPKNASEPDRYKSRIDKEDEEELFARVINGSVNLTIFILEVIGEFKK
jgi:hypothetical protein